MNLIKMFKNLKKKCKFDYFFMKYKKYLQIQKKLDFFKKFLN